MPHEMTRIPGGLRKPCQACDFLPEPERHNASYECKDCQVVLCCEERKHFNYKSGFKYWHEGGVLCIGIQTEDIDEQSSPKRKKVDQDSTQEGTIAMDKPKVTPQVRERVAVLEERLPPTLVGLVQDYDLTGYVGRILHRWTPESLTWPDPSRNPLVTRYLLEYHDTDVVVPYLNLLFKHITHEVFGTTDGGCGYADTATADTDFFHPCVYCDINLCKSLTLEEHRDGIEMIQGVINHAKEEHRIEFCISLENGDFEDDRDFKFDASSYTSLFTMCPLFTPGTMVLRGTGELNELLFHYQD